MKHAPCQGSTNCPRNPDICPFASCPLREKQETNYPEAGKEAPRDREVRRNAENGARLLTNFVAFVKKHNRDYPDYPVKIRQKGTRITIRAGDIKDPLAEAYLYETGQYT